MLEIDSATDWGNGSDGAVTYSSNTTLTSDVQATTLVVNAGVTVAIGWNSSAGRPALIQATTSITVNGTISARGSDGGSGATNTPGAGGASLTGGGGGGGGRISSTPLGAAGTSGRPSSNGSAGSTGNVGGAGGPGDIAVGGVGGKVATGTPIPGAGGSIPTVFSDTLATTADLWIARGGAGGGGGSGNAAASSNCGAGGGGGGGSVLLASPVITVSSTGSLDAMGGAGGAGAAINAPDGGGGGGGSVVILTEDLTIRGSVLVTGGTVDTVSATGAVAGSDGTILIAATSPVALLGLSATVVPAKVVP